MEDFTLSVIVPAYNEACMIEKNILKINQYLKKFLVSFEIIVIDDGSTDNTSDVVAKLAKNINNLKVFKNDINYGKGYTIKKGVFAACFDYLLFSDADLSTPISEFNKFIGYLKQDIDIIIGSRAIEGSQILKKQSFLRRNMGKFFNFLVQLFLFRGIKDTQCGFKCFRKDVAFNLFRQQKINGFCFDAEILYIAKHYGYSIKEVPVRWINNSNTKVSLIKSSFRMLLDLFFIKKQKRRL